jgi:arylsulfatase A-like enzyme
VVVAGCAAAACSKDSASTQAAAQSVAASAPVVVSRDAAVAAVADASPDGRTGSGPPADANVVLVSIDSLRADMPWSGYPRPIAPRLTELEQRAVSYSRAYSVSSYTSMSLGGLLGGRLPSELTRSGYFFGTYRKDVFFPKVLQAAGIRTMAVMAHMYFNSAGFEQGFDEWKLVPGIKFDPNTDNDVTSPGSEELVEQLLGDPANDSRRFFFWVHFMDPHDVYNRHDGIDWGKSPRDRYDGEVTFTDRYVGKLLDFIAARPWARRTVIIVTADHGEEFGEHGMTRHGFELWQTLIRVPLMIVAPGASPRRIDVPRSALDLAPTILELFGLPVPTRFEGTSLVHEVYGAAAEERDVVVDLPATSNNGKRRALVHGDEKLICFEGDSVCKLFDLGKDAVEGSPIFRGEAYADMRERYQALVKTITEVPPYACGADCLNNAYMKQKN